MGVCLRNGLLNIICCWVRHEVNVQRLFDQFVAINVENLRGNTGNTRTLDMPCGKIWPWSDIWMRKFFEVFFTLALFCAKTSLRFKKFKQTVVEDFDAFDSVSNILSEVHSKRKLLSPSISMCLVFENSNLCVNNECTWCGCLRIERIFYSNQGLHAVSVL